MKNAEDIYPKWRSICTELAEKPLLTFRRHPWLNLMVEGSWEAVGQECIPYIKDRITPEQLDKFAESDSIGSPKVFYYKDISRIMSPTTLRYIKIALDLQDMFGDLSKLDIVEIGIGYGGQCKIIHDLCTPKSYTLVDYPEVLQLAFKFLSRFDTAKNVIYRRESNSSPTEYDLCISNYAYSEMDLKNQDFYNNAILNHSKQGFMLCNFDIKERLKTLNKNSEILSEIPFTHHLCFLYVWK